MSGDSNYGGNGSVHWVVRCKQNGGGGAPLKHWVGNGTGIDKKQDHYFTHHPESVEGHDPDVPGPGGKTSSVFTIAMRYYVNAVTDPAGVLETAKLNPPAVGSSGASATAVVAQKDVVLRLLDHLITEAQAARDAVAKGATEADVTAHVPLQNRTQIPQSGWEVKVSW